VKFAGSVKINNTIQMKAYCVPSKEISSYYYAAIYSAQIYNYTRVQSRRERGTTATQPFVMPAPLSHRQRCSPSSRLLPFVLGLSLFFQCDASA
jgi:hypothetical protein